MCLPSDLDGASLRSRLLEGGSVVGDQVVETPKRHSSIKAGSWRRMSRLSRMVVTSGMTVLDARPDLDRDQLGLVWGAVVGEIVPTGSFLQRMFTEGPQFASPLAFQNSVYSAPASHLSIAMKLTGPSETLSAGGATAALALMRGIDMIADGVAPYVLVLCGEDLNPVTRKAYEYSGYTEPFGESAAALLLERSDVGATIDVQPGIDLSSPGPVFARAASLPTEPALEPLPATYAPESVLGLSFAMGLPAVIAASYGGGKVVQRDQTLAYTVRVGAPTC
jgi:hypothetical protein